MTMNKNLATALIAFKKQKDCNMSEFAEELTIAKSSVQKLMKGKGNPRLETIEIIAEKSGIDAKTLLFNDYAVENTPEHHLLRLLSSFEKLSADDKASAVEHFDALLKLFMESE